LRMVIWPEASSAQNNIAAVSADGALSPNAAKMITSQKARTR
jgi:hypothetical protein